MTAATIILATEPLTLLAGHIVESNALNKIIPAVGALLLVVALARVSTIVSTPRNPKE